MKRILFFLISIYALAGSSSCVQDADIKLPDAKEKLVIGCFISPQDTLITATVQKSFLLGSVITSNDTIANAQVTLSDGITTVALPYNSTKRYYSIHPSLFPISSGKTYHLSVLSPDGLEAKASCIIPNQANFSLEATVDSVKTYWSSGSYPYYEYRVKSKWTDIPGEANFYKVAAEFLKKEKYDYPAYPPYVVVSSFRDIDFNDPVFTDQNRDGGNFSGNTLESSYSFSPNYQSNTIVLEKYVNVYLLTIDKNYYEYYRTKNIFSEDPFSEPANVFTNIEGGFGVFAGYQLFTKKVNLLN